jgi:hypothetical protein
MVRNDEGPFRTFPMKLEINRRDALGSMLAAASAVAAPNIVRGESGYPDRNIRIGFQLRPVAASTLSRG